MLILMGLILIWVLANGLKQSNSHHVVTESLVHCPSVEIGRNNTSNDIAEHIKIKILKIYSGNYNDKRELLVKNLCILERFEDPGDFLEAHEYIHDFIFNYYLHDNAG